MKQEYKIRILHMGLGRFHRGHQAVYYQRMNELGDNWKVASMSMRSPDARDSLRAVELHYPVLELDAEGSRLIWIDSICEALSSHEDRQRVLEIFELSELEIVTLTITEKGYDLNSAGKLDIQKKAIQDDLKNPLNPNSAIGLLALGIHTRRLKSLSGLTILSCDNVRENSLKLKNALIEYFTALQWNDDKFWLNHHLAFPCTMVDRIVPSLSPEKLEEFKIQSKTMNKELIATETFCQWVIEDNFIHTRPGWDKAGVEFVKDVKPFEEIKLKLLNASHSYLAYQGLIKGYEFVHEAISDQQLKLNVMNLYNEVIPTLELPLDFNIKAYTEKLIKRFQNEKLPHKLKQIAMDGSQKIPQRILPSLLEATLRGGPSERLIGVIVSWIDYSYKMIKGSEVFDDPMKDELMNIWSEDKQVWAGRILQTSLFESVPENLRQAMLLQFRLS